MPEQSRAELRARLAARIAELEAELLEAEVERLRGAHGEALYFLNQITTISNPDMGGNHSAGLSRDEYRSARRPHEWWRRLHDVRAALTETTETKEKTDD